MNTARYHHGNLPVALIDAAIELLVSEGEKGVTLRIVAERVGVSHTAPYRHFDDKSALLTAVAVEGYERLTHRLRLGRHGAKSAATALSRMAHAYLEFAEQHRRLFRLMLSRDDPRAAASAQQVGTTIKACLAQVVASERTLEARATQLWSQWHGIASLMVGGAISFNRAKRQAQSAITDATTPLR